MSVASDCLGETYMNVFVFAQLSKKADFLERAQALLLTVDAYHGLAKQGQGRSFLVKVWEVDFKRHKYRHSHCILHSLAFTKIMEAGAPWMNCKP